MNNSVRFAFVNSVAFYEALPASATHRRSELWLLGKTLSNFMGNQRMASASPKSGLVNAFGLSINLLPRLCSRFNHGTGQANLHAFYERGSGIWKQVTIRAFWRPSSWLYWTNNGPRPRFALPLTEWGSDFCAGDDGSCQQGAEPIVYLMQTGNVSNYLVMAVEGLCPFQTLWLGAGPSRYQASIAVSFLIKEY